MDITKLSIKQLQQSLQSGELSSQQVTQTYIDRIESLDPKIHSYLATTFDKAINLAKQADEKLLSHRKTGEAIPALTGIPLAVKDVLCLENVTCTCGSKILEKYRPPFNATSVQRLLDAGMIPLGKTNTDEFAMGSSTENSAYGVTHNPWNLDRVPGGSSGGSAAAVAARLAPIATGTDTGGSIRQPASFCGNTGLKTSYGRVSRYGLIAYGSSLDTVGLLGNNVEDNAILFEVMAGYDPRDATSVKEAVPQITLPQEPDLKGVRVGVPKEYFIEGIQEDVSARVKEAIQKLADLGAEIVEVSLPHTEYALPVYYLIAPAEASANLARYDGIRFGLRAEAENLADIYYNSRGAGFGREVKRRIMLGTYALSAGYYDAYYGQAQKVRTLIKQDFEKVFEQVDVIAAPVAPTTAFPIGEHGDDPLSMYLEDVFTLPANLAGVPGLAFPVGFDRDHMPVGMQIMGPHLGEAQLLRIGHAWQLATDWHKQFAEM